MSEDASPSPAGVAAGLNCVLDSPKQCYRWGRLLSSTLIRLRARYNGDLDQYLIYMVFVLTELSRRLQARAGTGPDGPADVGLNALSIADITEIPRETVRRKLGLLVRSGHLRLDDHHLYHLGDGYDPDDFLADFTPLLRKFYALP